MKNKQLLLKSKKTLEVIQEENEGIDIYKDDAVEICNLLKCFSNQIKFKKDCLINAILSERIESKEKISSLLKCNYIRNKIRQFLIIQNILENRKKMIEGFKIIQIYYKLKHLIELTKTNFIIPKSFLNENIIRKILISKIKDHFTCYNLNKRLLFIIPKKELNKIILNSQTIDKYNKHEKFLLDYLYHIIIEKDKEFNNILLNNFVKNSKIYDKSIKKSSSDVNILKYPSLSNFKINFKRKKTLSDLSKMDILNKIK